MKILHYNVFKNVPVGVRNHPASMNTALTQAGWGVMRENRSVTPSSPAKETQVQPQAEVETQSEKLSEEKAEQQTQQQTPVAAPAEHKTMTIERPVRSGQQFYAADSDITILASTSAGSEIMADGSIHVYGALRGRVLAGAKGNIKARIFCQSLQAELIAIAGCYQLLDESDTSLIGKPAMIRLEGEKLIIEPLAV